MKKQKAKTKKARTSISKMDDQVGIVMPKKEQKKALSINASLNVILKTAEQYNVAPIITNDEEFEVARARYKHVRALSAEVDEKQAKILDPLKESISEIKTLFKPATALLARACDAFEISLSKYANQQEIARQNALQRIESDKRLKNVETIQTKREEVGSRLSGTMKLKRVMITDYSAIPREYLVPDEKKILMALLAGKKVKGCKVIEELTIVNR